MANTNSKKITLILSVEDHKRILEGCEADKRSISSFIRKYSLDKVNELVGEN